jgi:hypothetical protein
MEDINCNLPAKVRLLEIQESIRLVIFIIKAWQSATMSLEEIRGTPRYLIGRTPSFICIVDNKRCFILLDAPAKKMELLEGLAFNPDKHSNSFKTCWITFTDLRLAFEKLSKSFAKHKWDNLC